MKNPTELFTPLWLFELRSEETRQGGRMRRTDLLRGDVVLPPAEWVQVLDTSSDKNKNKNSFGALPLKWFHFESGQFVCM